jgi:predicted DNA-binding transcriptional regulator AlpA
MTIRLIYHTIESATGGVSPFDDVLTTTTRGQDILIGCPYLSLDYLKRLIHHSHSWNLITDIQAWMKAYPRLVQLEIHQFIETHLQHIRYRPNFHAKVFLAGTCALTGSANFTIPGVCQNVEVSVFFRDEPHVAELRQWFQDQWVQAQSVDRDGLAAYVQKLHRTSAAQVHEPRIALPSHTPRIHAILLPDNPMRPKKTCPTCGLHESDMDNRIGAPVRFYRGASYCVVCHRERQQQSRSKPNRHCPDCKRIAGEVDPNTGKETRFYKSATYCAVCHRARQKQSQQRPEVRAKMNAYNLAWLKRHPEVQKQAGRAYVERQRAQRRAARPAVVLTLTETAQVLGLSRQRIYQYMVDGRLPAGRDTSGKRVRLWFKQADVERFRQERDRDHEPQAEGQ